MALCIDFFLKKVQSLDMAKMVITNYSPTEMWSQFRENKSGQKCML